MEAHFPNPPPSLAAVTGGGVQGGGARPAVPGGGVNPTSMAQIDNHVALIILTTQMWGGGIIGGKNFFGPNFVFLRLCRQHLFLHKTKGPTRNPISPNPPPPSFGGRPCHPPPPPTEQFSGRPAPLPPGNSHICAKPIVVVVMGSPPGLGQRTCRCSTPTYSTVVGLCAGVRQPGALPWHRRIRGPPQH